MESHKFSSQNPLYMAIFNSYVLPRIGHSGCQQMLCKNRQFWFLICSDFSARFAISTFPRIGERRKNPRLKRLLCAWEIHHMEEKYKWEFIHCQVCLPEVEP